MDKLISLAVKPEKTGENTYKGILVHTNKHIESHGLLFLPSAFENQSLSNVPILLDHTQETMNVVGKMTNLETSGDLVMIEWKFADTTQANEAKKLVDDNFVTGLSVGYLITEFVEKKIDGGEWVMEISRGVIREASITPFPADDGARILLSLQEKQKKEQDLILARDRRLADTRDELMMRYLLIKQKELGKNGN